MKPKPLEIKILKILATHTVPLSPVLISDLGSFDINSVRLYLANLLYPKKWVDRTRRGYYRITKEGLHVIG